jgi:hypothetical protein
MTCSTNFYKNIPILFYRTKQNIRKNIVIINKQSSSLAAFFGACFIMNILQQTKSAQDEYVKYILSTIKEQHLRIYKRPLEPDELTMHDLCGLITSIPEFTVTARGSFAVVFTKLGVPGVVHRISVKSLDSWIHYAQFAQTLSGISVPKFAGIAIEGSITITVLEELVSICDENCDEVLEGYELHGAFIDACVKCVTTVQYKEPTDTLYKTLINKIQKTTNKIIGSNLCSDSFILTHKNFIEVYHTTLNRLCYNNRFEDDLHYGNAMLRGNVLVLTDPIF